MKYSIVIFPGSNCDHDAYNAIKKNLGYNAEFIWHKEGSLPKDTDCVLLPGGFAHGDYLRCGAIARFSPIMNDVTKFAEKGGYIIGICNGFQVLTESHLLPGALLRNRDLNFICEDIYLTCCNTNTAFTNLVPTDRPLRIPISHGEGNYYADKDTIDELESNNRIIFRYSNIKGEVTPESNPNGSINNIAAIINKEGNILGMMPHPERYCDNILGCEDGKYIFQSLFEHLK